MTTEAERLNIILTARDKELAAAIDRNTKRIARFAANTNRDLGRTSQGFDRLGKSARNSAAATSGMLNVSAGGRFVLQNTAAQLGDIAVQLESGTAASRVMAQQLPQLFGGFSALGGALGLLAPLLGTLMAVGIPLAAFFYSTGKDADEAGEKVKSFADKIAAAEAAMKRASAAATLASAGGLDELGEVYGEVTEKVRDLAEALADIERRAALVSISDVMDDAFGDTFRAELNKLYGAVGEALTTAGTASAQAQAEEIRAAMRDLQAEINTIGLTGQPVPPQMAQQMTELGEELAAVEGRLADIGSLASELQVPADVLASVSDLVAALETARAAGDFSAMADAISQIRTALEDAGAEIDQGVLDAMVQAEDQARKFAYQLGQANDTAVDLGDAAAGIASGLAPAVSEAIKLADWLGISLATAQRLAALGPQGLPGSGEQGRGGAVDPRSVGGTFLDWNTRDAQAFLANWKPPKSGGGGGKAADDLKKYDQAVKALEKSFSDSSAAAAQYREALAELQAQYEAGDLSQEQFEAGVDRLKTEFEAAARRAKSLRDQAAQTFTDIVTGATSVNDAVSQLFSNLAGQFANAAFGGLFKDVGIFDALGGLLSFDGGGTTPTGPRSGGVDGKGGFPAILHPNETVIDHTKPGMASASGGGAVAITVDVSGARGNSEIMDMVEAGVRQGLEQYDRSVLPRSVQAISRDPRRIG